ncbi:MAG: hypothetical protein OXT67_13305 [Zetaproteobacteria bacterium]|nr:hypothetical protein [Zetaproteobacteria bacterium]
MRSLYSMQLFCILTLVHISPLYANYKEREEYFPKGRRNQLVRMFMKLHGPRARHAYDHTVIESKRALSDWQPMGLHSNIHGPRVDVWKYMYQPKGMTEPITSNRPISTLRRYWKNSNEARIIALSLFGNKQKYLDGILDFLHSFQRIKEVNRIPATQMWGYETFTVRVYVAKRAPYNNMPGELQGATAENFVQQLLEAGAEIAFVDNHRDQVGLDATFWRFMVAGEQMPPGEKIRYLMRDVDWKLTAAEAYGVGDWLNSNATYHRLHVLPVCMGPLTASIWAGQHEGAGDMANMQTMMEYYPYRLRYGDDELFLRDMVWPTMKASGSVLTHHYPRKWLSKFASPYRYSCEEPTAKFCAKLNPNHHCVDAIIPDQVLFPVKDLAYDARLMKIKDKYFYLNLDVGSVALAVQSLYPQ